MITLHVEYATDENTTLNIIGSKHFLDKEQCNSVLNYAMNMKCFFQINNAGVGSDECRVKEPNISQTFILGSYKLDSIMVQI